MFNYDIKKLIMTQKLAPKTAVLKPTKIARVDRAKSKKNGAEELLHLLNHISQSLVFAQKLLGGPILKNFTQTNYITSTSRCQISLVESTAQNTP